jgi:hypothetical protein
MTVAERFHRLGLVIVVLATASYAMASEAIGTALASAGLAVVGWVLTSGGAKRVLPAWLTAGLIWLAVGRAVFLAFSGGLDISAFCEFLLAVIVVKMWDRKLAKDWSQILTLSAFLVVGSVLTSNALGTGLILAAGVPLFVYAVILLQVCHASQRATAAAASAGAAEPAASVWSRGLGVQVRRAAMWSLMGGLVLSLAVFFIMPRDIGRGSFGRWLQARASSVSGFSDTVQLGRSGPIYTSREIVLDMLVRNDQGRNIGSQGRIFYLRGATTDQYRGEGLWGQPYDSNRAMDTLYPGTVRRVRSPAEGPAGPGAITQEFLVRNASSRTALFALWQPVSLQLEKTTEIQVDRETLTMLRETGTVGPMRYSVTSDSGVPRNVMPHARQPGITFPSERIRVLAETILRAADVDPDPSTRPFEADSTAARAVETYLRENYLYSLDQQPTPRGRDPIEWFLEEGKQGHCEYFASAMTAMLRSVGINARLVTGYVAADFNSTTGHYTVRESNAHAWVETQVHTGEWRQYDPTPPANFHQFHDRPRTLSSDLFGFLDAIEYAWVDSVIGFDESSRLRLFGGRGPTVPWFDGVASRLTTRAQTGGKRLLNAAIFNGLLAMGLVAGVGFVVVGLSRLQQRRRRPAWEVAGASAEEQARLESMARFYDDMLRIWARAGKPKPATATPLAHARTMLGGRASELSASLSDRFYKVRFGRRALTESEVAQIEADLADLAGLARAGGLSVRDGSGISGPEPGSGASARG